MSTIPVAVVWYLNFINLTFREYVRRTCKPGYEFLQFVAIGQLISSQALYVLQIRLYPEQAVSLCYCILIYFSIIESFCLNSAINLHMHSNFKEKYMFLYILNQKLMVSFSHYFCCFHVQNIHMTFISHYSDTSLNDRDAFLKTVMLPESLLMEVKITCKVYGWVPKTKKWNIFHTQKFFLFKINKIQLKITFMYNQSVKT
jgi:hypothetical protein